MLALSLFVALNIRATTFFDMPIFPIFFTAPTLLFVCVAVGIRLIYENTDIYNKWILFS